MQETTDTNIEVSATEKQVGIQLNIETEAPKSLNDGSEAVSAPLDTPAVETQTESPETKVGDASVEPKNDDTQNSPAQKVNAYLFLV